MLTLFRPRFSVQFYRYSACQVMNLATLFPPQKYEMIVIRSLNGNRIYNRLL